MVEEEQGLGLVCRILPRQVRQQPRSRFGFTDTQIDSDLTITQLDQG